MQRSFINFAINTRMRNLYSGLENSRLYRFYAIRRIFLSQHIADTYMRAIRRTNRGTKYFAKLTKVHRQFSPHGRRKEGRRSHPVGYRRGRWATNNSMCAYKLIRLPTTLLHRGAPARPSIRPGSNSFEFVLRPPWRRRRRITRDSFAREWNASEFTARFNSSVDLRVFICLLLRSLQTAAGKRREYREN